LSRLFGGGTTSDLGCGTTDKVVFKTELFRLDLFGFFFYQGKKVNIKQKNPLKIRISSPQPISPIALTELA
jgi:hypothetical protein